MISIGNDIVDLSAIDKQRTQQKAFYSKILSTTEQQLYSRPAIATLPFEVFVWLLWSAKESVYKFAKRLNPDLIFSPVRIACEFEPEFSELRNEQNLILDDIQVNSINQSFSQFLNSGSDKSKSIIFQATHQSQTYYLQSLITPNFIATLASDTPNSGNIHWGIKRIEQSDYESQSVAVREFMLKRISEVFPDETNFSINKSPIGYPIILKELNETDIKASFAHHGNYVAYAFGE